MAGSRCTARAADKKIGEPDVLTLQGDGLEVLAGGFRSDRFRPEEIELAEREPARLVSERGIGSRERLRVRWFVRGSGMATIGYSGDKARDVERAWGIVGFDVRVGVNTGQAAVGLVGAVDVQTVAFGDTVNVAARLQTIAKPGTIVVGDEAARRLSHRFLLEPHGAVEIKGKGPLSTYFLIGRNTKP